MKVFYSRARLLFRVVNSITIILIVLNRIQKKRDKVLAQENTRGGKDGNSISTTGRVMSTSRVIQRIGQKNQRKGRLHRIRVTRRNSTAVISSRHSARSDGFYPITSHE